MNPHDICMSSLLWDTRTLADFENLNDGDESDLMDYRARINQLSWRPAYQAIPTSDFKIDKYAKLPANFAATDNFPISNMSSVNSGFNRDDRQRAHIWFYYRLMEQVDAEIGTVLDALNVSQYKDNTVIMFTSDHGEMAISHNLTGKNLPYQECQRVPLIFAGKGVPKGVVDLTTPVCNGWDMLPTLLDLAGVEKPATGFLGLSLYDRITKDEALNRKYLYYETVNSYGILGDGRYKYTRFVTTSTNPYTLNPGQTESLFDLHSDPGELNNLVDAASQASKLSELRSALSSEMKRCGTTF